VAAAGHVQGTWSSPDLGKQFGNAQVYVTVASTVTFTSRPTEAVPLTLLAACGTARATPLNASYQLSSM
jgi:hypothetical protein